MIINRENYEAFLLDLMEGNLSDDQENILRSFLEENPDLDIDDNLTDIRLPEIGEFPVSGINFPLKEELKKGGMNNVINAGNFEQFCIARLEGDLSGQLESRLEEFLSDNPDLRKSAETFRFTILEADRSVVFPEKDTLKKGNKATLELKDYFKRKSIYKAVSIAASVAIMFSVFNLLSDSLVTDPAINQDKQDVNISDNQSAALESDAMPVPVSPDRSSVETADNAGREFMETSRSGTSEPLLSVTSESMSDISQPLAGREPVLLPVKNISPVEVNMIRTDFSSVILRPVQTAVNHREQEYQERSGAGMIINGILAFATRNVEKNEDEGGLNIWNIADAGFRGINSLTGAELRLEREFNQEGELVSMAFSSRVLEFRRTSYAKEN